MVKNLKNQFSGYKFAWDPTFVVIQFILFGIGLICSESSSFSPKTGLAQALKAFHFPPKTCHSLFTYHLSLFTFHYFHKSCKNTVFLQFHFSLLTRMSQFPLTFHFSPGEGFVGFFGGISFLILRFRFFVCEIGFPPKCCTRPAFPTNLHTFWNILMT